MELEIKRYMRNPFYVEAVQVADDNMEKIADWCGGRIKDDERQSKKYVRVWVTQVVKERQTKAFAGDWVVKLKDGGYKIYTDGSFERSFIQYFGEPQVGLSGTVEWDIDNNIPLYTRDHLRIESEKPMNFNEYAIHRDPDAPVLELSRQSTFIEGIDPMDADSNGLGEDPAEEGVCPSAPYHVGMATGFVDAQGHAVTEEHWRGVLAEHEPIDRGTDDV